MKKIGLGIVLGALGLSNAIKPAQDDGASILINWSNNKGESKVFKIDDVEKELGNEKIHSKTLLQKYVRTSRPGCSFSRSKSCARKLSCSASRSCSRKKYSCSPVCKPCKPCKFKKVRSHRPIIIEHRPVYKKHIVYKPKKKQNKYHAKDYKQRSASRCSENEECYDKDYDKNSKKLSLEDLMKLYKVNKNSKSNKSVKRSSASKCKKSNSVSKYLKDTNKNSAKKNSERSCSNENIKNFKAANSAKDSKKKCKNNEKSHENEMKKCHNIVNMNVKKNEALLMKEKDKDNLHSSDKIIEEFDKLEHFKKVEERCRSASKARHANVKKNDCVDKAQKQHNGASTQENRMNNKSRFNKDKECSAFDMKDTNKENRNSKFLKDNKECDDECENEKEFAKRDCLDKFNANSARKSHDESDSCDLLNKKDCKSKDCKDVKINDDCNRLKKRKSRNQSNEKRECSLDKCYN